MNFTAQIIGLIASITMIGAIQVKEKKTFYLIFVLIKMLYSINFALLGDYAGTLTQLIGLFITIVAYICAKKNWNIPIWLILFFIIITIIGGIFTFKNIFSILVIGCGITYALIMGAKNMRTIRGLNFLQSLLWVIYDFIVGAYTSSISSIFVFISTLIAIFRYDFRKRDKVG